MQLYSIIIIKLGYNIKKNYVKIVLLGFALFYFTNVFGQARKELNFGLVGINYEIPVHKDIKIAPGIGTNLDIDWLNIRSKGKLLF